MPASALPCRRFAVLFLAVAAACPPSDQVAIKAPTPNSLNALNGPACAHDDGESLSVPGLLGAIPEYHDCQRFRARDLTPGPGATFGAKYAIFVRDDLEVAYAKGASDSGAPAPRQPSGRVAAVSSAPPGQTVVAAARQQLLTGLTIGVVWAGADWLPLKVRRGLNCLVLQIPTPGTYKAFMLPISGNTDSLCLMAVLPLPPSQELDVRAVSLPLPATDVPPHARWDHDGVSRKADPFILIRCPDGVCEIFEQGSVHNSSAPEPGPTATTPHEKRILLAKLWFDEQVLASPTASGPLPQIEPNGPRGTLFPHPDLDSYTVASFTPGVWLPTAGVRVTGGNPNLYRAKLGVEPGPRPDWAAKRGNIFHMCTDTLYTAGGVQSGNPCGVADATRLRCPNGHFFARMFVNNTMKSEFCVMMTKFPANIEVRGVTRWHFLDTDDTVWWRCPRGCCEVQLH